MVCVGYSTRVVARRFGFSRGPKRRIKETAADGTTGQRTAYFGFIVMFIMFVNDITVLVY